MKKSNAKEKICGLASYAVLTVLTVAACWFFAGRYGVFGANMDWISQHSVFPEYFRQQFYQTGQFFPEYAANIGGGQNIYNFSYYGLYNPIVLIAYLLPFVKMSDYLMAASVICLAVSVCLLYGWLKKRGIKKLKVVYSKEKPLTPVDDMATSCRSHCVCPPGTARNCTARRQIPGSISFVPSVVGLIIAGEVIKDLVGVH